MSTTVVINGSPRANGRSAAVERLLLERLRDAGIVDPLVFRVCDSQVHGCMGCGLCEAEGTCVFGDDMVELLENLHMADNVFVVSPIYFSGVPAQMKAVLDRFQPFFYERMKLRKQSGSLPPKRPLMLYLVGEGGDPHGYEPAVAMCKSAFQVANFKLVGLQAFIAQNQPKTTSEIDIKGE